MLDLSELPWKLQGTCAQPGSPDLWFSDDEAETAEAKSKCNSCPVLAQCFDYALRKAPYYGTWAGLSEDERRTFRRTHTPHIRNRVKVG